MITKTSFHVWPEETFGSVSPKGPSAHYSRVVLAVANRLLGEFAARPRPLQTLKRLATPAEEPELKLLKGL
jgi:hypothetical protein